MRLTFHNYVSHYLVLEVTYFIVATEKKQEMDDSWSETP